VFIPGLTDAMGSVEYTAKLQLMCASLGLSFLQPQLSSSNAGYGTASLNDDVAEMDAVLDHPEVAAIKDRALFLVGHSTGCQDIVNYLRSGAHRSRVTAVVLQAPVSDREAMAMAALQQSSDELSRLKSAADSAKRLVDAGKGNHLMPRDAPQAFGVPITAERYYSLSGHMTNDDMFSSDLSDKELASVLGHIACPALFALSGADEYVPQAVLESYGALGDRFASATASECFARVAVIEGGNHALDNSKSASDAFVSLLESFFLGYL